MRRPSVRRALRDAVWWVQDYAFAARWQLRAVTSHRDPALYLSGNGRPVVVLPGVWETWAFLRPLVARVHAAGHPVHVLASLRWNSRPVEATARDVAAYILENELTDVVLVAHSKGGLIGKYVMALLDDTRRVRSMVAICSPFSGSRYAAWLPLPSLRAFSPRDATTLLLARNEEVNSRIVSIYGEFDPHIPEGSFLPGAENVSLHAGGHFRILALPRTIATVLRVAAHDGSMTTDDEDATTRHDFGEAVNMTAGEIESWLDTDESKEVGQKTGGHESTGHASGRRIVKILRTKQADLTDADHAHMRKVVGYVARHSEQRPAGDVTDTPWRWSLMNWGHDPKKN